LLFACAHPDLSPKVQVVITLKYVVNLKVEAIAKVLGMTIDGIDKLLLRARQKIRQDKIPFEVPVGYKMQRRAQAVLESIYLLFNEGYNSTQHEELIRKDLLEESLRLGQLLVHHPSTKRSNVFALLALICFNTARNEARLDKEGNILLLEKQDRKLWNRSLIQQGFDYIDQSAEGDMLTAYHIEAAIAAEYVSAASYQATNWKNILHYYDLLYELHPAAIVALNRAVVIAELYGPAEGMNSIENIPDIDSLKNYYRLPAILGELYLKMNEKGKAAGFFLEAARLTGSEAEKKLLTQKINRL